MSRVLGLYVLSLAVLTLAPGAWADDDALQNAKRRVAEGTEQYRQGQYADALIAFNQAHQLVPKNGRVFFNIAQAEAKLGRLDAAAENYEQFLESTTHDPGVDHVSLEEAKIELKKARANYAVVRVLVKTADGRPVPDSVHFRIIDTTQARDTTSTRIYLPVTPASHGIVGRAPGWASKKVKVTTSAPGPQADSVVVLEAESDAAVEGERACYRLEADCSEAGFVKGGAFTGKGLAKDCVIPLRQGHTVAGVTADPDDIKTCLEKGPKYLPRRGGQGGKAARESE
jgi:tetratricopeptide (TPR) repeat protein